MTKDLIEYYKNIKYLSKEVAEYKDNEGNRFICNPASLILGIQYAELNKEQFEQAKFQGLIDKDTIYKEIEIDKPIPKYDITHKPEDKYTITTAKQKVKQVWYLKNTLGINKACNSKEQADEIYEKINNEIAKICKLGVELK